MKLSGKSRPWAWCTTSPSSSIHWLADFLVNKTEKQPNNVQQPKTLPPANKKKVNHQLHEIAPWKKEYPEENDYQNAPAMYPSIQSVGLQDSGEQTD